MSGGNYLRKRRKSFFLSSDACEIISQLSYRLGLSEGAVIEIAVRRLHEKEIGPWPCTGPVNAVRKE